MIKRIIGLGGAALAVSAGTLGVTTAPAQATGNTTGEVVSHINLRIRSGPTMAAHTQGSSAPGSHLTVKCATHGATVDGNDLWYRIPGEHHWVSARYVGHVASTPGSCGHGGPDGAGKRASSPAGEADATVRAWGRGDRGVVKRLAQPAVVHTLFRHTNRGGPHWRRTGASGAMGTSYFTYRNDATGARLVLGVTNQRIPGAAAPAVRTARFS